MTTGFVKKSYSEKGYFFLGRSDGGKDVFCHISAVERAGLHTLAEGQALEFEIVLNPQTGRSCAEKLRLL
jgi:CspA family cold shock protein